MDKKLKFFVACCAIALAVISTTTEVKAGSAAMEQGSNRSHDLSPAGCYGSGTCGITTKGTILVGKWRE